MCRSKCSSLLLLAHLRLIVFPSFILFSSTVASFCGKSGVPYSFEVLSTGAPVLGCAQPSCVISATDAERDFHEDSQFFTNAEGQPDGFFRDGDRVLKRYRHATAPKLIANCSGQFNELSCPRKNQWTNFAMLHLRGPSFFSRGWLNGGRTRRGHYRRGSVSKSEGEAPGKVRYEVTVRRMNCLPDPPELEVEFDGDVPLEVSKLLGNAKNKELTDKINGVQNGIGKKTVIKQKSRKDGQPKAKQQTAPAGQRNGQHLQQRKQQAELPEVSGAENSSRSTRISHHNMKNSSCSSISNLKEASNNSMENTGTHFEEQQNQQPLQQQLRQTAPTLSQFASPQQQFDAGSQQQQQQQQQQFVGEAITAEPSAFASFSVTPHPLFGTMSFPTLPPHSFPTLPPHSFPTLPPHSFPTLPPHSFPTLPPHTFFSLPPHTFPTFPPHTFASVDAFTAAPATGGSSSGGSSGAFAAPTFNAVSSGPIPLSSAGGSFGGASQPREADNSINTSGQRQQQQLPDFQPQNTPKMAPAMGTILAAMHARALFAVDVVVLLWGRGGTNSFILPPSDSANSIGECLPVYSPSLPPRRLCFSSRWFAFSFLFPSLPFVVVLPPVMFLHVSPPPAPSLRLCDQCLKPISSDEEQTILTASQRPFHPNCFFCSKKQCGRALSLEEYGVHQNQIFCAYCFISLFSIERNVSLQPEKNGHENDVVVQKEKAAQHYERQLRIVQLGDDDNDDGEHEIVVSRRTSDWHGDFVAEEGLLLTMSQKGRGSSPHRRAGRFAPLLTSPIPELDERETTEQEDGPVSQSTANSPYPEASAAFHFLPPCNRSKSTCPPPLAFLRPSVCKRCAQRVFEAEKVVAAGEVWHKRCFRCLRCGRSLEPGKFSDRVGEIFCNSCYAKQFGPKGFQRHSQRSEITPTVTCWGGISTAIHPATGGLLVPPLSPKSRRVKSKTMDCRNKMLVHCLKTTNWFTTGQMPKKHDIMGENLLESYNPLYDVHLRQYFALPHMQKHLRNLGLLDGSPVQQQNELNRERVLQQLMDLQRKLDAVEKVELYRRIRSGITNADESADRHQHMSRSLSRPARSAAARLGERRGRRQSLSPEAGELIKRVESDYRSDSAPFKNPKSIYNRLAASVYKYQYLHKLDDRTLRKYMLSLRKQLAKLERFREVSFGPHTMAKHPPLQLQQSWFFRRRSLPSLNSANANQSRTHTQQTNAGGQRSLKSGLAPKARSGKSQSPLKFASAIDEPPPKMQRRTSISRTRQQRLPPLPKKRSFAASRTNTLPTSKTLERLPPTATTKPIRNTPSDTRRALPPSSAQKKTPTGSRPGSKGSTTPVFVQKRSSASSGILPAIGGAAVAAAAVGLVLENGGKRAEEGQGRESVAPSPSISLAASQTTTTDGGQPGGDSESEEQLKDSAKTAPEGMNGNWPREFGL
uniref:LIM zinc-binding domain-containing protein n=1 Tax=Globodera rostochiensis TaxID=31243 RepID=A0A914GWN0_GLORO